MLRGTDVYRDGQQLASVAPGGVVKHFHLDHLGTVRRITDGSQTVVASHDYWPFGEEATDPYADAERMKFTGHERDLRDPEKTTDDLDYMHARYYSPNLGRFLSVDPGRDSHATAPQSWGLYLYVQGNPLKATDPDGRLTDWDRGVGVGSPTSKVPWSPSVTPEQRAVALAIMGPLGVTVGVGLAALGAPQLTATAVGAGATGLVIGGREEAYSDHPIDVKFQNTAISGGVAAVAGGLAFKVSPLVRRGNKTAEMVVKGVAGIVGAAADASLKGQSMNAQSVAGVAGSGSNAMVAHAIAQVAPPKLQAITEYATLIVLESAKAIGMQRLLKTNSETERQDK